MDEFLSSHELLNLEEELRSSNSALYVYKNDIEGLAQSFKSLSLRTGWAIYLWENNEGLLNLKSSEPTAPKTGTFKEAIKFALARKHFSVFVFPINDSDAWNEAHLFFSTIDNELDGAVKFLFILSRGQKHIFFERKAKEVKFNLGLDGNFVLRDGKWVNISDLP
ncbi:MAG: hypothetical protein R3E90_14465 [Marinicella sp.]|nr:hypothetical protein [Xanthomonadales bacterium]